LSFEYSLELKRLHLQFAIINANKQWNKYRNGKKKLKLFHLNIVEIMCFA